MQAILVSVERTGIGPAAINLYGVKEKCSFVSRCIMLHTRLREPCFRQGYCQMWRFQFGTRHSHEEQVGQSAK